MAEIDVKCDALRLFALKVGADGAECMSASEVKVDPEYIQYCAKAYCSGYGRSLSCPPHAMKPDVFMTELSSFLQALVFKVDAPVEALLGSDRLKVARKVHELASLIESEAVRLGVANVRGIAAGSCKELFCSERDYCDALHGSGEFCHFRTVRPSLSALGIDAGVLCDRAGWNLSWEQFSDKGGGPEKKMGLMLGMVLLK